MAGLDNTDTRQAAKSADSGSNIYAECDLAREQVPKMASNVDKAEDTDAGRSTAMKVGAAVGGVGGAAGGAGLGLAEAGFATVAQNGGTIGILLKEMACGGSASFYAPTAAEILEVTALGGAVGLCAGIAAGAAIGLVGYELWKHAPSLPSLPHLKLEW